jgi:Base plate wedge protein 53
VEEYFAKFPLISYANTVTRDLTRRVTVADTYLRIPTAYYPYEVKAGTRPDALAHFAYKDPTVEWVLYLMNGITDPYYDWYLSEEQFHSLIVEKYGSYAAAVERTAFYRVNWASDEVELSVSHYENQLLKGLKRYYSPVFSGTRIVSYRRSQDDATVNTNRVIRVDFGGVLTGTFEASELVTSSSGGTGELTYVGDSYVLVRHVGGSWTAPATVTGVTSGATFTSAEVTTVLENVTPDEEVYWEPVSFYEVERERNERNKIINVIDESYVLPMAEQLRQKLLEE